MKTIQHADTTTTLIGSSISGVWRRDDWTVAANNYTTTVDYNRLNH